VRLKKKLKKFKGKKICRQKSKNIYQKVLYFKRRFFLLSLPLFVLYDDDDD